MRQEFWISTIPTGQARPRFYRRAERSYKMRRTKEWWARLTPEERSELVYIERNASQASDADYWRKIAENKK